MSNYLGSTQIAAFPVVNRDAEHSGDIYARHTSEEILSGIVNKLIDADGFVITLKDKFGLDKEFAFNIHGYYFKIKQLSDLIALFNNIEVGDKIYAEISLKNYGLWGQWVEIEGQDETDDTEVTTESEFHYTGVNFTLVKANEKYIQQNANNVSFSIPLLTYVGTSSTQNWDGGWYVPDANYVKFSKSSYVMERIDGGDLDNKN